ncbi:MAG: hypothetical protein L0K08_07230 [Bifidobacterium mongoliense]|nr:hypothetical protein [Bifidobacterium mongoliense]
MSSIEWEQQWDAAQTVQQHLVVDGIVPSSLSGGGGVDGTVPGDRVGWAATGVFDDAQDLPVEEHDMGATRCREVRGRVDGVRVTVRAFRPVVRSDVQQVGTVADLTGADS